MDGNENTLDFDESYQKVSYRVLRLGRNVIITPAVAVALDKINHQDTPIADQRQEGKGPYYTMSSSLDRLQRRIFRHAHPW